MFSLAGHILGFLAGFLHEIFLDADAVIGIGFLPDLFRCPVVLSGGLINHGQERRDFNELVADIAGIFVFFVTDRFPAEVGGRQVNGQRLAPGSGGGLQNVYERAVFLGVQFINQDQVGVESVFRLGLMGQRLSDHAVFPVLHRLVGSVTLDQIG